MAKRTYSRKGSKIQPAVQTMTFYVNVPVGSSTHFLDVNQVTSILNRRFYRQGLNNAIAGFKVLSNAGFTGGMTISKLPNTWVMSNAWEKGFRAWQRQQRDALEDGSQESVRAKFNDFKIFADADHLSSGVVNNLMPVSFGGTFTPGEWDSSQIVIPNYGAPGVNYEPYLIGVGADVPGIGGAVSLIAAYQNSRGVPQSPDPAVPAGITNADNIYRAMFDVGDNNEDVMENVVGKNDELPYPQELYPNGSAQGVGLQLHDLEFITGTTIGGTTHLKGGNFPCGLIRFDIVNNSLDSDIITLQVNLIPGNHRGYLCEPMTEM